MHIEVTGGLGIQGLLQTLNRSVDASAFRIRLIVFGVSFVSWGFLPLHLI